MPDKFETLDLAYEYIRDDFQERIKEDVGVLNGKYFANSDYLHYLALTDFQLSNTTERLYIITKGFLRPYTGFLKEKLKKTIERVKDVKVLSLSNDGKVKRLFVDELKVDESCFFVKTGLSAKHTIIGDQSVRTSTNDCDEDTDVNSIRADVTLNNTFYADLKAKEFNKCLEA